MDDLIFQKRMMQVTHNFLRELTDIIIWAESELTSGYLNNREVAIELRRKRIHAWDRKEAALKKLKSEL